MKQTFKVVTVYTGYAEYGIENVYEMTSDDIHNATLEVRDNNHEMLRDDDVDEQFIAEFFTGIRQLHNDVYEIAYGEENVQLVIAPDHPMYHLVEQSSTWTDECQSSKWTNEQWNDWVHLLQSDVHRITV